MFPILTGDSGGGAGGSGRLQVREERGGGESLSIWLFVVVRCSSSEKMKRGWGRRRDGGRIGDCFCLHFARERVEWGERAGEQWLGKMEAFVLCLAEEVTRRRGDADRGVSSGYGSGDILAEKKGGAAF
ncbi:hypothetical protein HAX54_045325 [Datura stramonium]|uniref:Uncharacterized protein n=1 Tax=Datura stramonium TaxID=4076 RepID=A0ABS8RR22_DATST|nr:hypothetical protein [Datura stramonium]